MTTGQTGEATTPNPSQPLASGKPNGRDDMSETTNATKPGKGNKGGKGNHAESAANPAPETNGTPAEPTAPTAPVAGESAAPATPAAPAGKPKKDKTVPDMKECPEGGEKMTVLLKDIVVDPIFQARKALFDPPTATRYGELRKDGVVFPPLYIYDTGTRMILFGGFNRYHGFQEAGFKDADCVVWKGSDRDAKFWSLRQNPKHGLPRSQSDIRKAINTLLEDPVMLAEVLTKAKEWTGTDKGGAHRGVAAWLGVSTGALQNALDERGESLSVSGLRKKPTPAPAAPEPTAPTAPAAPVVNLTPEQLTAQAEREAINKEQRNKVVVHSTLIVCAKLQRWSETIMERAEVRDILRKHLTANAVQLEVAGEEGAEKTTIPVLQRIITALEASVEEFKAQEAKATLPIPGATAEPKKYPDSDTSEEAKLWRLENPGK